MNEGDTLILEEWDKDKKEYTGRKIEVVATYILKTKGQTEQDIIALNFEHSHIFRPSMIQGNRKEKGPAEIIFGTIWKIINPFLFGRLNKYKAIDAKQIAIAMIQAAKNPSGKVMTLIRPIPRIFSSTR